MIGVDIPNLNNPFFHGSRTSGITSFCLGNCETRNPFGPAIYFSADPAVAASYAGSNGQVYMAILCGSQDHVIALNLQFSEQTKAAQQAISKLLLWAGCDQHLRDQAIDARGLIEAADPIFGKQKRNQILQTLGIWLVFGELSEMERSGLCDRGIQYAVINTSMISLR